MTCSLYENIYTTPKLLYSFRKFFFSPFSPSHPFFLNLLPSRFIFFLTINLPPVFSNYLYLSHYQFTPVFSNYLYLPPSLASSQTPSLLLILFFSPFLPLSQYSFLFLPTSFCSSVNQLKRILMKFVSSKDYKKASASIVESVTMKLYIRCSHKDLEM